MTSPIELQIKKLYHAYRHTSDIDQKGLFFSPTCMQICRPIPSYAATSRAGIVKYLKDVQTGDMPVAQTEQPQEPAAETEPLSRAVYTIRRLHAAEHEFSSNVITAAVGLSPSQLLQQSRDEAWVGMRVDLWDEGAPDVGLLVQVQYWWRKESVNTGEEVEGDVVGEAMGWRQCLHDIISLGPKDGSEGQEGLEVLE
ncbi:hypothetical protein EK21DRAFT_71403 [Setomelanomma holmii]|uniref:SnoaL-like domain-containing protein n=1 Tax=Setomelanomma holmii TaxID=210430 RepID=A0A9P4H522_9PLEO|nr:hypothetical protein EK21DRAFT_71403 [Setomelanomma holmii]